MTAPDATAEPGDGLVARFAAAYGFPLDDFQIEAVSSLAAGGSVLVAAPTGAGKTVVGEFAVWRSLATGGKCFYTTPIKALSNQKYHDLAAWYGPDKVGLLTGDNSVNGEAPVVVMTTEVLRNMLYEASPTLVGLQAVVLDEVHYLADRERGAVWEEVIVQLPAAVQLACLSATVSNAEEFGAWLHSVRDHCDVVISEFRPVPLEHHYAVNDRIYPVFVSGERKAGGRGSKERVDAARQARGGVPNPDVRMLERRARAGSRGGRPGRGGHRGHRPRLRPPLRSTLVEELARREWLPAISFIFSRAGCNNAVRQLVGDGVRLTSTAERRRIREVAERRVADLSDAELDVLGFAEWVEALEAGIAAHHAGLIPVFKETVEELFVANLVKVCFATETLALGINMPARTVVIERLEKWTGQSHEQLTPGQFTQLTGRAGRRGLDERGHAVVLYQRDIDFPTVASLVGRRVEPLVSSFAPSYNMAVNLLRRHDREQAEALLARSFAQYQADASVGDDEQRIVRNREALAGYAENLWSEHGDFDEFWRLRRELSSLETTGAKERKRRRREQVLEALEALEAGDVVALENGAGPPDLAVVVSRTRSSKGVPLAGAVTEDRRHVRLGPREFDAPPRKVARIALPNAGGPRKAAYRKELAQTLRGLDRPKGRPSTVEEPAEVTERISELRAALRAHPVHHDPQLPEIEVWAHRYDDLQAETERLEQRVRRATGSLVRQFAQIRAVLRDLDYLSDDEADPQPTAAGLLLAGLYAETDLLLAEAIREGLLDGLDPADLAAVASIFVHETRQKDPPLPRYPTEAVASAAQEVVELWGRLAEREQREGLAPTRSPDLGFVEVVWHWASGADLDEALGDWELTPGDFVRSTKQVADLLGQIRDAVGDAPLSATAHRAMRSIVRGVVAHTGL